MTTTSARSNSAWYVNSCTRRASAGAAAPNRTAITASQLTGVFIWLFASQKNEADIIGRLSVTRRGNNLRFAHIRGGSVNVRQFHRGGRAHNVQILGSDRGRGACGR